VRTARPPLARRVLAELVGTGMLVMVVVGSGIAAARLSPNDRGLQLLENSTDRARSGGADPAVRAGVRSAFEPCSSTAGLHPGRHDVPAVAPASERARHDDARAARA
jgi:hypothetical protein